MTERLIYGTAIAIALVLCGWYVIHIWSDCLGDHSAFTCMRMLNK